VSSVDPIEQGWLDAADAEARGCPAPALIAVAALTGPMGLPEEARVHIADERCPYCERGLQTMWRRRLPLVDLMVEAPSAPPGGAFATALRAKLATIDTEDARRALARLPEPPGERVSSRRTASRLAERAGALFSELFFPPSPSPLGALNDATGRDTRPLKAGTPGDFGPVTIEPAGTGSAVMKVDFGKLPDFGEDDALVFVLREWEPDPLAEARFTETAGTQTAKLELDPGLIDGYELRVMITRVPR
jgi:hypothetical protein